MVDELPRKCEKPTYVVTGTRFREPFMDNNDIYTMTNPGEAWHKCCDVGDKDNPKLECEAVDVLSVNKLVNEHKGFCGPHKCIGERDRCLVLDPREEDYKAKKRHECPLACWKKCVKKTQRLECVYVGQEPKFGHEGDETPVFGGQHGSGEPEQFEKYAVYSLGMPGHLALLPLRIPGRPWCERGHRDSWGSFL
jgi:hypothetical protein